MRPALLGALRVSGEFCGVGLGSGFVDVREGSWEGSWSRLFFEGPHRATALSGVFCSPSPLNCTCFAAAASLLVWLFILFVCLFNLHLRICYLLILEKEALM